MISVAGRSRLHVHCVSGVSIHGSYGAVCKEAEAPGRLRILAGEVGNCDSSVLAGNDTTLRLHDDKCILAFGSRTEVGGDGTIS